MRLAVWQIRSDTPVRVVAGNVRLERELEDWIARDPSLAVEGLEVVGRQIILEGGRLDLLGVDPQGVWTVVEIKRGRLYRDTVAQALDYASSVSTMPPARLREIVGGHAGEDVARRSPVAEALGEGESGEPRDVRVVVVGTGRDSSLDRIVQYLGDNYDVPIQVVTFEVFAVEPDGQILVREVTEAEPPATEHAAATRYRLDEVFGVAKQHGTADAFQVMYEFAQHEGLYARPWKWSIMYTPPSARNRALMTVWTKPNGELRIYVAPASTFAEFFPIAEKEAQGVLGSDEWYVVRGREEAAALTSRLTPLFALPPDPA
jgi:hypothetical protein